jgi:hypothetical protein
MHPDKPTISPWTALITAARRLLDERNRTIMQKDGMQISIFDSQIVVWHADGQPVASFTWIDGRAQYFREGWDHTRAAALFNSL